MNQSIFSIFFNSNSAASPANAVINGSTDSSIDFQKVLSSSVHKITNKEADKNQSEYAKYLYGFVNLNNQSLPGSLAGENSNPLTNDRPVALTNSSSSSDRGANLLEQFESVKIPTTEIIDLLKAAENSISLNLGKLIDSGSVEGLPAGIKSILSQIKSSSGSNIDLGQSGNFKNLVSELDQLTNLVASQTKQMIPVVPAFENLETGTVKVNSATNMLKLVFASSDLVEEPDLNITAKITSKDSPANHIEMTVKDLKSLISKYPDKIMIEIKARSENATATRPDQRPLTLAAQKTNVASANKSEPVILVDLKQLATMENNRHVTVVIKQQLKSDHKGLKFDSIDSIKTVLKTDIKSESGLPEFRQFVKQSLNDDVKPGFMDKPLQQNHKTKTQNQNLSVNKSNSSEQSSNKFIELGGKPSDAKTGVRNTTNLNTEVASPDSIKTEQFGLIRDQKIVNVPGEMQKQVIEQIEQLADRMKMRFNAIGKNSQMVLYLKPASLGKVIIDLKCRSEKVEAIFRVDNPAVKQIIENELPKLRLDMKFDECRVELNNSGDQSHSKYASDRNANSKMAMSKYDNSNDDNNIESQPLKNIASANIYGGAIDMVA